jgi:hypothetical protein
MEFLLGAVVFLVLLRVFAGHSARPLSGRRKPVAPAPAAAAHGLPVDQARAPTAAGPPRIQRGRHFKTMRLGSGSPRIDERRRGFRLIRGGSRDRQT